MQWNEKSRGFEDGSGGIVSLPFVRSRDQAERWAAAGFDFDAAVTRKQVFAKDWRTAATYREASSVLNAFLGDMAEAARKAGLEDDPDFASISRSARAYEWDPPEAGD